MTKKINNLSEGLRRGDLEDQILPMVSFDEYESNFGEEALTVAFFLQSKDAANDLNKFLQKSQVNFLTTDISPSQDKDGYFAVFIEFKIDDKLVANFIDILDEINQLCLIEKWQIHLNNRELMPFSRRALDFYIHARYGKNLVLEDVADTSKARTFLAKNLTHISKYFANKNFGCEEQARDEYFRSLERDDKSPWAQAMPSSINGPVVNRQIADLLPIYKVGKSFRIGVKPKTETKDPWREIDIVRPDLGNLITNGIINQFDGYDVLGLKMLPVKELTMIEDHSYTAGGVAKVERLAHQIPESGKFVAIVVNQDYEILDGHHRFRAIRDILRWKVIPALVVKVYDGTEETNEGVLNEDVTTGLEYENRHIDGHSGQHDFSLLAKKDGKIVGKVDYSVYNDEVHMKMIKVVPALMRKGIGTGLMKKLQSLYPETEINTGSQTEDGAKFFKGLPTSDIAIPEIQKKFKRLEEVKAKLAQYEQEFNDLTDGHSKSVFIDEHPDWNDLHDEVDDLERELHNKKPYKTMVQ